MKNLIYRAVENSKNTIGESGNHPAGGSGQLSLELIDELASIAKSMGCTHFFNHVQMDTNTQMQTYHPQYAANYNLRTLEEEAKAWADAAHRHGLKVGWRGGWSGVKGNSGFPYVTYGTGGFIPLGTVAGAASEGETTYCGKLWRFMDVNVGASRWQDGDIVAPISECTEFLSNSNYIWFDTSGGVQTGMQNFFLTMHDVVDAYAASIGKSLQYLTIINYSEYRSGYLGNTLPNDTGFIAIDYYGHRGYNNGEHVEPQHYVEDWQAVYAQVNPSSAKIFQTEMGGIFGTSWPTIGANASLHNRRITTYEESVKYQMDFYRAYRDNLIPGTLFGMNNWGFWSGQNSSILGFSNGHYYLNYMGQIYANFIKGNGMGRIPVPSERPTLLNSTGNRSIHF